MTVVSTVPRVNILREAREWLKDNDSAHNILWILGAPGAGKSTIATTLAKELSATCARFFCERDEPRLRDPRQIWPTIAYNVAVKHDGVKVALALALAGKHFEPQDHSALEQFENLFEAPLQTVLKETAYPVIIIDALTNATRRPSPTGSRSLHR